MVGLNGSKLFCIVCKNPDSFPQVLPKPVLTLLNLSFPLASSDLGEEALENEFMLNNLHRSQVLSLYLCIWAFRGLSVNKICSF